MTKVQAWCSKKFGVDRDSRKFKRLESLSLPKPRKSITPTPSALDLHHEQRPNNDFHLRFPYEIRRQILLEAFGNQTIHMHLVYGLLKLSTYNRIKKNTLQSYYPHAGIEEEPDLEMGTPKWKEHDWNWWSCVCHRNSPHRLGTPFADGPCHDQCERGSTEMCEFWPGAKGIKCKIGVMGWLLSCRQAYLEVVDILYATNTIHISSVPLLLNIHSLLVPKRLASITSLELRWELVKIGVANLAAYNQLLTTTPFNFPQLRHIYLAFTEIFLPTQNGVSSIKQNDEWIFQPFEKMLRNMASLTEAEMDVPLSLYDQRRLKMKGEPVKPGWGLLGNERLWVDLENENDAEEHKHITGYWLYLGKMNRQLLYLTSNMH